MMLARWRSRLRRNLSIGLVFALAALLFLIASLAVSGFASANNLRNVLIQAVILAVVGAGQTFVIIGGGIDLSVPWMMTTGGVLIAVLSEGHDAALPGAILVVLALAAGVGLVNGAGVTVLSVPPIIMTLATNVMLSGGIVLYVGDSPPSKAPDSVVNLAFGDVHGLPIDAIILIITLLVSSVLLTLTPFGRRLYAIGTSERVSRFSGVQPLGVVMGSYVLCSLSAAVAGIVLLGYVGTSYLGMGDPYQFASIAAAIVGGASVLGGSGHYVGTLAGVLLLTILNSLLIVFNLGAGSISIFYGVTVLVSVWLASARVGQRRP
jgi:ribose transport system permease protein